MVGVVVAPACLAAAGFDVTVLLPLFSDGIALWSSLVDTALPVYSSGVPDATLSLCPCVNFARGISESEDAPSLDGELEGEAQFGVVQIMAQKGTGAGEAVDERIAVQVQDLFGS